MDQGEPKNGDFVSLVENLSTSKLEVIRQENEQLISNFPMHPHTNPSPANSSNGLSKLLETWHAYRQQKETEENGVGTVHHKQKLNLIQLVMLFTVIFLLSTDEFGEYGTEAFSIWFDRLIFWIDELSYSLSNWLY